MMSVCGRYVGTFAEASHALPQGMHMNADYPFMLPKISSVTATHVTLAGDRHGILATAKIKRDKGREWCELNQSSGFERIYGRSAQRFRFDPFKDEHTPAISQTQEQPR
jgi:hypothetical protein